MGVAGRDVGGVAVLGDVGLQPRGRGDVKDHVEGVVAPAPGLPPAHKELEGVERAHPREHHGGRPRGAGLGDVLLPLLGGSVEAPQVVEALAPVAPAKDEHGLAGEAGAVAIPRARARAPRGRLYLIPLSFGYKLIQ